MVRRPKSGPVGNGLEVEDVEPEISECSTKRKTSHFRLENEVCTRKDWMDRQSDICEVRCLGTDGRKVVVRRLKFARVQDGAICGRTGGGKEWEIHEE